MTDDQVRDEDADKASRGRYRDALRSRDFRLLLSSALIDGFGNWAYSVVIAVVVFDRTHSALWLSAVSSSRWLTSLLVGSYAGILADRYERTRVMVVSATMSAIVMVGLTIAVATRAPVGLLLAGSVLAALAGAPYQPAAGALTPEVVSERDLAAANALLSTVETLVVVIGPAIGGAFLLVGPAAGVAFNAATFVMAALLVLRLSVTSRGEVVAGQPVIEVWLAGVRALAGQRVAVGLVVFALLDTAVYGASSVIYAPLSVHLHTGVNGYSYLLAASALGSVIAAGIANRLADARHMAAVIVGGVVLEAAPFALTAATTSPAVAAVLQVLSGVGMVVVDVLALTALQRDLPRGVLSRVLGVFGALSTGACLIGSVIAGALVAAFGVVPALLAIGLGGSLLAVLLLPVARPGDRAQAASLAAIAPRVELLSRLDLFTGANRNVLERLAAVAVEEQVPGGHPIIRQGDPADALWVLVSGTLAVSLTGPDGAAHPLPEVTAPGYVGEIGLVRRVPRTASVSAREPSVLLRIDGQAFLDALETAPPSLSFVQLTGVRWERTAA